MEENQNYKYYVVAFTDPPYTDFNKYVCVPDSWMVLREVETQTGIVKYPIEQISITKKRVKKKETFAKDWPVFDANVKFGTNSYKKAKNYIKLLNNMLIQERSFAIFVENGNEPSTSEIKTRGSQFDREVNKPMTSGRNGDSSTRTTTPEPSTSKMVSNCKLADSNVDNKFVDSNSVDNKRYCTRQSHQSYLSNSKSLSSSLNSLKQNNLEDKSDNRDSYQNKATENHENSGFKSGETNQEFLFDHDFLAALKHLKLCLDIESKKAENFAIDCKKYATLMQIMIGLVENFNSNCTDSLAHIINMTAAIIQKEDNEKEKVTGHEKTNDVASAKAEKNGEIEKKTVNKNQKDECDDNDANDDGDHNNNNDDDDDDDSDDSDYDHNDVEDDDIDIDDDDDGSHHHQQQHHRHVKNKDKGKEKNQDKSCEKQVQSNSQDTVSKKRSILRKFTLPPDYDKNDSRWTLRYRENSKNLVELMPHSHVYVNAIRLNNCKRLSKDSKTLARKLLVEIFTESALSTCSLTGKKANAFAVDKSKIRPGLDDHARTVLLNYVENHAIKNHWVKLDTQSILNSLRNKIQAMRYKYG